MESKKDRLPHGRGSRAGKDAIFCESLFDSIRFSSGALSTFYYEPTI